MRRSGGVVFFFFLSVRLTWVAGLFFIVVFNERVGWGEIQIVVSLFFSTRHACVPAALARSPAVSISRVQREEMRVKLGLWGIAPG